MPRAFAPPQGGDHGLAADCGSGDTFPRGEGAPVRTLGRMRNGDMLWTGGSLFKGTPVRSPPAFLISQRLVSRSLTASPRGKLWRPSGGCALHAPEGAAPGGSYGGYAAGPSRAPAPTMRTAPFVGRMSDPAAYFTGVSGHGFSLHLPRLPLRGAGKNRLFGTDFLTEGWQCAENHPSEPLFAAHLPSSGGFFAASPQRAVVGAGACIAPHSFGRFFSFGGFVFLLLVVKYRKKERK